MSMDPSVNRDQFMECGNVEDFQIIEYIELCLDLFILTASPQPPPKGDNLFYGKSPY